MAGISAMQKLLDNQLTSRFARSLKHSDLPEGWADNPEIVALAEDAYREMGTESPFFKAWFGNSKVVDEAGEPLEVYHGTNAYDLKKFKPGNSGYLGGGIYTTPSRKTAERYTDYDTVYSLFERMENPFVVSGADSAPLILKELYGNGAEKALAKREAKQGNASKILTKADAKKIQGKGYDGIFWDAPSGKEYSTLDPTSIKSTSNRGTFNPADPNIYKGIPWAIGAGAGALALAPEDAEAASYTGLKQLGGEALDYMMKHRPEVDEDMSAGLHDLEELFPSIYGKKAGAYSTHSGADVDSEAMAAINAARGNPDAEVDIFRAVPQGVRDFNVGDWVTTSKSYAHEHGGHALNGEYDIITGKAKASDLYNPGDSIAEMGYWGLPMAGKVTRGLIPAVGAGGLLSLMGADEAEAAPYQFPADKRGTVLYEPGLGSPIVDPADLLTAPIGVPTAALKAASVAAEPFISYGMDKAINGILGLFYGDEEGQ